MEGGDGEAMEGRRRGDGEAMEGRWRDDGETVVRRWTGDGEAMERGFWRGMENGGGMVSDGGTKRDDVGTMDDGEAIGNDKGTAGMRWREDHPSRHSHPPASPGADTGGNAPGGRTARRSRAVSRPAARRDGASKPRGVAAVLHGLPARMLVLIY